MTKDKTTYLGCLYCSPNQGCRGLHHPMIIRSKVTSLLPYFLSFSKDKKDKKKKIGRIFSDSRIQKKLINLLTRNNMKICSNYSIFNTYNEINDEDFFFLY